MHNFRQTQPDRNTDRHRQTDRQTDRQTGRQTDRQIIYATKVFETIIIRKASALRRRAIFDKAIEQLFQCNCNCESST